MTLAVLAILIPSLRGMVGGEAGGLDAAAAESFSLFVAWVLLAVFALTLLFSLKTHRTLYAVAEADLIVDGEDPGHSCGSAHRPPLLPWVALLLSATVGVAKASELFVGVVESVTESPGLSALFTGVVLLPLLGGAAEHLTAVSMARKDKMDLAVSVATAVLVSNLVSLDGRSDWLEGVLLLVAYAILAAGFFFQSSPLP